jgi:EAL domain-containing protein (putative c-di-GMP-specific phosphodiesterase class I)
MLPPMRFLPLVEEMGLSAAMFATIVSQTCAAIRGWPERIRVSVNVSPHELQDESLPEDVRAILETHGIAGSRLEIEVTENALIHDSRIARGVIDRLRALGMSMALDDFGTGFSSLYHLREMPFDKIKIDKSFMRALDTDADSARYVAAIIGLGKSLGLEVTAEGVEDSACMKRLMELGCTYGQGYLFGRPMPAAEAGRLLVGAGTAVMAAE